MLILGIVPSARIIGMDTDGITTGTILGGEAPIIGIPTATTRGGDGTTIITPSTTMVTTTDGILHSEVIITIITPHAQRIAALQLPTADTAPAQSVAHAHR